MRLLLTLAIWLPITSALLADAPPPAGKTVSLFDGKSLDGWEGDGKLWRVEDDVITGGSLTETIKHNDFLASTKDYGDFIVRFEIKLTGAGGFINSGFQIRSQRVPKNSEMSGYQCDFGEPNWYGAIYDESRRNKVMAASDMAALRPVIKKDGWNEYVIRAQGPRVTTWINGVQGVDYTEADSAIARTGKFGIQVHGGGKALVQVRNISIEELAPPKHGSYFEGAPAVKKYAKPSPLAPAEQQGTFSLPPGFEIELVATETEGVGKFVPIAFDQKGALWTTTALEYPVDGNENPAAADALYASKAKDKVVVYDRDPASPTGYSQKPRIFAEGLAIPLGVLPYKNGCYVQHGHDIAFLSDTDGDGKADKREVTLTGFGVQDSHLFPHQFLRAPGGWIWMAQGAFNYSKVRKPNEPAEKAVQFDQTRMAKFRPDGAEFTITSNGPCNIWGLVLDGNGQSWIQEANDFGYPVMPFHEFGNYPGCSDRQWKSYAPEFPGTAKDFRMGGTGLSGLALSDAKGAWPGAYANVMYVANPITRQIQAIKITPDGPRFKYEKLPDFINSSDEWFRPVATTFGPDGCLYIVDWYNKIISHNEVPRNHPERDKARGRIWRVKYKEQKPFEVPDFTKAAEEVLLAKLGGESLAQSHLAWQAITDRNLQSLAGKLRDIAAEGKNTGRTLAAMWAMDGLGAVKLDDLRNLLKSADRNVRREALNLIGSRIGGQVASEAAKSLGNLADAVATEKDPEVRNAFMRVIANYLDAMKPDAFPVPPAEAIQALQQLLSFDQSPLSTPVGPSTRNGKPIKIAEAYEREFDRYVSRMTLERHPKLVQHFLDSPESAKLPVESRLLASLALEPNASAQRVAKLLPQLTRPAGEEELLRLAQYPDEPGVGEALKAVLQNPATRTAALESLLKVRTRLDAAKLAPFLSDAAKQLIGSPDEAAVALGARLAESFQLPGMEEVLVAVLEKNISESRDTIQGQAEHRTYLQVKPAGIQALNALRTLKSDKLDLFDRLARFGEQPEVRNAAVSAMAASKAPDAGERLLKLWPGLAADGRRSALDKLSTTKPGAKTVVAAVKTGTIAKTDLDGPTIERLQALLGANDPDLAPMLNELAALFRPVLVLNGSEDAWTETGLVLDGPFTVECWVRLDPGISNADSILGAPGQLDINFFDAKLRVWVGGGVNDAVISKKPATADLWTHVAVTRDEAGNLKIYQDGELASDKSKSVTQKFENVRVGWNQPPKGTSGAMAEFRIWKIARNADEIRRDFDRSFSAAEKPSALVLLASGAEGWGKLRAGAKIVKTSDFPPVMSAAEASALDAKFAKYRALTQKPGDAARGKLVAATCQACHLFKGQGASIGPDLSGVGAMGDEAILRNILTPNAAMENGYRIYRIELKNGDLLESFFVSEDKDAVVIRQPGLPDRRIAKAEIRSTKFLRRSLMPEGLIDALSAEQVSDLFTYLRSMK